MWQRHSSRPKLKVLITTLLLQVLAVSSSSTSTSTSVRGLEEDKFADLNSLIAGVGVELPSIEVSQDLGGFVGEVTLGVDELVCSNFFIGDISVSHRIRSETRITNTVDVSGLTVTCTFKWSYKASAISGDGEGSIVTNQNALREIVATTSDDFSTTPPNELEHVRCTSNVNVEEINIDGIRGIFKDAITNFFSDILGVAISNALCDEAESTIPTLNPHLVGVSELIKNYTLSEVDIDTTDTKTSSTLDDAADLVDLTDMEMIFDDPIMSALFKASKTLNKVFSPDKKGSDQPSEDLVVNLWLRESMLDKNGYVTKSPTDLKLRGDGTVYKNGHELSGLLIELEDVRFGGMDSVTNINPFQISGPQTIQTSVSWDSLALNFQMSMGIYLQRMDKEYNILQKPFEINMELQNVQTTVELQTALNKTKYEELTLQADSLIGTDILFPCVLSTAAYDGLFNVTEFTLESGDYQPPTITGLDSDGMLDIASSITDSFHSMYGDSMQQDIEVFIARDGRELLKKLVRDYMAENINCPV